MPRRFTDSHEARVRATAAEAFEPIRRIGGDTGWYFGDVLWELRGAVDRWAGGEGVRRGRRDPDAIAVGDTIDFWRVEAFEPDRSLRLCAEMKLPGHAWLQFDVEPEGDGSRIRQTSEFEPSGPAGVAYWYLVYPLHSFVFGGMLRGVARRAEEVARQSTDQGDLTPPGPAAR